MSIFIDKNTKVMVQGITGSAGSFHAGQMVSYGTQVVAGVTPGRGGQTFNESVPVFTTVAEAAAETGANATAIFVPPLVCCDAILEACDAGIETIVAITEGIPVLDMIGVRRHEGQRQPTDRTELPGHYHAGRVQDRDHARAHSPVRPDRCREQVGYADL